MNDDANPVVEPEIGVSCLLHGAGEGGILLHAAILFQPLYNNYVIF